VSGAPNLNPNNPNPFNVKAGQVWKTLAPTMRERHVKVVAIRPTLPGAPARCEVHMCRPNGDIFREKGRPTITYPRLDRFRPVTDGYALVRDVNPEHTQRRLF